MLKSEIVVGGVYRVVGRKDLVEVTNAVADGWVCRVVGQPGKTVKAGSERFFRERVEAPAPKAKKTRAPKADGTPRKLSLIGAAAQVLAGCKPEAMHVRPLYEKLVADGLWTPGAGKTPAQTLAAAIITEINTKGAESRFVRTDRGAFAAA